MMSRSSYQRTKMWCAIRALKKFSVKQIAEITQVPSDFAYRYLCMLRRYGYLNWQEGDKDHSRFELIKDTGSGAPVDGRNGLSDPNMAGQVCDSYQRMWNAICRLRFWHAEKLAEAAQVSKTTAWRYSLGLATAGIVTRQMRDKKIKTSTDCFELIRVTGTQAPLFLENAELFDPNLFLQELQAKHSKKTKTSKPSNKSGVWIL